MSDFTTAVILHHVKKENNHSRQTINSLSKQSTQNFEVYIINKSDDGNLADLDNMPLPPASIKLINVKQDKTLGNHLNQIIKKISAPYLLYIDNRQNQVNIKQAALDLMLLHMEQYPQTAMIYSDYDLRDGDTLNGQKLLKHHCGRLRDNQDYGRVFLFRMSALKTVGGFDAALQFNVLYDIRLRLSANHTLTHISNKYSGALYEVKAQAKGQNVFDYLVAGKESQIEAENILSRHLKETGAYLPPAVHYQTRPEPAENLSLDATIIIPVNNRPQFIGTAIESVQAQTNGNIEIIVVVNGGEEDPTIPEVQKYIAGGNRFDSTKPQVRLLVYDVNNIGFCLNMGTKNARGKYYVQLDSDDRLKPDAVERILAVYKNDPQTGMVIGSYEVWEKRADGSLSQVKEIPVVTHDEWTEDNGRNNLLRINGAGAPRSIPITLLRQMGFGMNDEPYTRNYGEDYDMVLRISEKYLIGRVWEAIYEVVRHSGGTDHSIDQFTVDQNDEAKDWMRKQALKRRKILNKK